MNEELARKIREKCFPERTDWDLLSEDAKQDWVKIAEGCKEIFTEKPKGIKFKPFTWECTDGPAIELSTQLDCNAYVTYSEQEDGKLTYEASFADVYKRGFENQKEAKEWVENEFKQRVLRHLECAGWQSIETAPKDGKCILWVETDDGGEMMILPRNKKGDWVYEGEPTYCSSFYLEPTLWAPLPERPTTKTHNNE